MHGGEFIDINHVVLWTPAGKAYVYQIPGTSEAQEQEIVESSGRQPIQRSESSHILHEEKYPTVKLLAICTAGETDDSSLEYDNQSCRSTSYQLL